MASREYGVTNCHGSSQNRLEFPGYTIIEIMKLVMYYLKILKINFTFNINIRYSEHNEILPDRVSCFSGIKMILLFLDKITLHPLLDKAN